MPPWKDCDEDPFLFEISIPKGLSVLARHDVNAFVPGIEDILDGVDYDNEGNRINTVSYADRIEMGRLAHDALRAYDKAVSSGDQEARVAALQSLRDNYKYFGYGYLESPEQAIPPIAMTFYTFHIMVMAGGYLLLFFVAVMIFVYRFPKILRQRWMQWVAMLTIPVVWVCSQSGWITAEVGRQPWIIQDLMPVRAAISDISAASVQLTFWMFAAVFTLLLAAEISIMLRQIAKASQEPDVADANINNPKN